MNVRKLVKKIVTVGTMSGLLVGATMMGAFAASAHSLNNLPAPFVKDGVADFRIVLGQGADVGDMLGAIDISNALQATAVTQEVIEIPGQTTTSIEGGVRLAASGKILMLDKVFSDVKDRFTATDMPRLLADGVVEIDGATNVDYLQRLHMSDDMAVTFMRDTDWDIPQVAINTRNGTDVMYTLEVDFTSPLNVSRLTDSESIEIAGRTFTFAQTNGVTGDITMFGSDETQFLRIGQPMTMNVEGTAYEVEIVGGNSDIPNIVLSVNGQRRTVREGDNVRIAGLDIYVRDVFVTNIPSLDASANLFVGSEEVKLPQAGTNFSVVRVGNDNLDGYEVRVLGANNGAVTGMEFVWKPYDMNPTVEYIMPGDELVDPLFGTMKVVFGGPTEALEASTRKHVAFERTGREMSFTFTNEDGHTISFRPFEVRSDTVLNYRGLHAANNMQGFVGNVSTNLQRRSIFILEEGDRISKVYEVERFTTENNVDRVELRDLGTGGTLRLEHGAQIGSTGVTIALDYAGRQFNLSQAPLKDVFTQGGMRIVFNDDGAVVGSTGVNFSITLTEDAFLSGNNAVQTTPTSVSANVVGVDNEVRLTGTLPGAISDDNGNVDYVLTEYGTYIKHERDDNGRYLRVWYPTRELSYDFFIAPVGAQRTVVGGGSAISADRVNPIAVGAAVLDTDLNSVVAANTNLIVVGGPAINTIASELLGNPVDPMEGFTPGRAIIELFDLDNGKVAMLVAGTQVLETQVASRAVARAITVGDSRMTGDRVNLQVTSRDQFTVTSAQ